MSAWMMGLTLATTGMIASGEPGRRSARATSRRTGRRVEPLAAPPPKIAIRPKKKAGTVVVSWQLAGAEARAGSPGVIRADLLARPKSFVMEMELEGVVSSYPIEHATLFVRNAPSSQISRVEIVRTRRGVLKWLLDGHQLPTCEPGGRRQPCQHSGLPLEFFVELYGIFAECCDGALLPRIVIDW
ncbi:MAG: hypothetical protein JSV80_02530 [Acidobacteriota bacterium]|nr:MAG: hypothetical protein JSV80_02530 [Acidobacteriota bacterium]